MSQQKINFAPAAVGEQKESHSTSQTTPGAASSSSSGQQNRGSKRTYIELNVEKLCELFGAPAGKPSASSSGSIQLNEPAIRAAYRKHNSDMQHTIDELVETTGLHPELHSRYEAQLAADAAASSSGDESSLPAASSVLKKQRSTRMVFEQKQGDLFACEPHSALAHCVSECLAMGKGIATEFKRRFGGMSELKAQNKKIGEVAVLQREKRFIYYLITKHRYWNKPTMADLERSLFAMREHMIAHGVKLVSMPRIGCGLDGLLWPAVSALIKEVFKDTDARIVVYTR